MKQPPVLLLLASIAISAAISAIVVSAQRSQPIPPPYATPSADNPPRVVPRPKGASLHVPDGFTIDAWATGFARPRFMIQGSNGEVLVADSGEGRHDGAVYAIDPSHPSARKTLIDHLDRPYGLARWKQYLYVAEPESVTRYVYDADKRVAGRGQEVVSLAGLGRGHWTRSLLFDRRGDNLYVGVGSAANVEAGEDPRRAAINVYAPDGSDHRIFASGLRNPVGLHWYPNSDTLWASVEERDDLGDHVPSDFFTHVQDHGFYGWPYAYLGPHPDPRLEGEWPDLVSRTTAPDVLLGAHVAVLDFTFYTGDRFPAEYRGGAFLAFHGSWNRSARAGYAVAFVPFSHGRPSGDVKPFVTGWMVSPDKKDVWGRPVAVLELRDGSLLISDDGGRKIWRCASR